MMSVPVWRMRFSVSIFAAGEAGGAACVGAAAGAAGVGAVFPGALSWATAARAVKPTTSAVVGNMSKRLAAVIATPSGDGSRSFELGPGLLDVQPLHRVGRLARRCFLVELLGFGEAPLAEQKDEPVRIFDAGNRRFGIELQRFLKMLDRRILFRAVRHPRDETADLVDDLRLKAPVRCVRVGVLGLELEGCQQRFLDLAAKTLRQRFG